MALSPSPAIIAILVCSLLAGQDRASPPIVYREPFSNFRLGLPEGWAFGPAAHPLRYDGRTAQGESLGLEIVRAKTDLKAFVQELCHNLDKVDADKSIRVGGRPARRVSAGNRLWIVVDAGDRKFILSYAGGEARTVDWVAESLRIFPEHPFSAGRKKEFDELSAAGAWDRIRERFPHYPEGHAQAGQAALAAGDYARAADALGKAVALDPDEPLYSFDLSRALAAIHRLPEAEKAIRKSVELRPDYEPAWTMLGYVYLRQREYAKAREALQRAIRLDPTSHLAHSNLGAAFEGEGNYAAAAEEYRTALRIKPGDPEAQAGLARVSGKR